MIEQLFSPELVHALGWTLVHTLWQAALFALLLGLLLVVLRKYSALTRYVVAIGMLATFFLTSGLTFSRLYFKASPVATQTEAPTLSEAAVASAPVPTEAEAAPSVRPQTRETTAVSFRQRFVNYYNDHLPLIVTLWLMGVLILQLRFIGQLAFLQRLKNYGTERFPARFAPVFQELESKLGISKPVRYLSSFRVSSPFTAGWLRPVILFPAALLEELNEAQLRTILAHELAHVKRYDFLVNLSQTLLCILFFYHPAVWWMSARVEEEREHCCDDLAIAVTGEKVGYAKTLLQLKETEISGGRLAMNLKGNGKGFAFRVKRLLGNGLGTGTYGEGFTTAVIIAACIGLALNLSGQDQGAQPRVQGEDQMSELSSPPPPPPPPAPIAPVSPDEAEEVRDAIRLEAQRQVPGEATPGGKFLLFMNAIYEGEQEMVAYMLENEDLDLNQTDEHDFTPLMAAASENHTTILKMLIDAGADVNHLNGQGWTALIEAADEGAYECAEILLENGADVNLKGKWNSRSALGMAASEGHPRMISLLVQAGADIFSMSEETHPLLLAAEEGQLKTIRLLMDLGAEPSTHDNQGRTALMFAASEGHDDVVRYLLSNGANPNDADQEGRTAAYYAIAENKTDILKVLDKYGAVPLARKVVGDDEFVHHRQGERAYFTAVNDGNYETVAYLLDKGTDPNTKNSSGYTGLDISAREGKMSLVRLFYERTEPTRKQLGHALYLAAREGKTDVVKFLLDKGARIDSRNGSGYTALELAAREGKTYTVRFLLENSPEDLNLDRALQLAAREGKLSTVTLLLDQGADPKASDNSGNTPLELAAREGQSEVVKLLSSLGPENIDLNEPLLLAAREGKTSTVRYLLGQGADINYADQNGSTALSLAAREGKSGLVKYLLEVDARPDGDPAGCSPVFLAAREKNADVIQLLAARGADLERGCSFRDIDFFNHNEGNNNTIAVYENATPLIVALTESSAATASTLLTRGANINASIRKLRFTTNRQLDYRDSENLTEAYLRENFTMNYEADGWTPLMEAVESGQSDLVILLLRQGADRNASTKQGLTALKLAQQMKFTDIARILQ